MAVKVGIVAERWLSKWVLRLVCDCQSGYCGWYVAVKVGIVVGM